MKFQLPLIAVRDLERSKAFYQQVLGQRIMMDLGANVSFEGFAIQQGYDMLCCGLRAAEQPRALF